MTKTFIFLVLMVSYMMVTANSAMLEQSSSILIQSNSTVSRTAKAFGEALDNTSNAHAHNIPAMFVMGDSLVDVGNNNYLPLSVLKANYFPYGIDFPGHVASGRFSNGRLVVDIIANMLGFPTPSSYLSPNTKGLALLRGVNYASAGCGILNETTNNSSGCLSLSKQLGYHENTVHRIMEQLGYDTGQSFLNQSFYLLLIGSNDFLGNYIRNSSRDSKLSPPEFIQLLVSSYTTQIKRLYDQYARKIVIVGLGPLGCIPNIRTKTSDGNCNEFLNSWVQSFNDALKEGVLKFGSDHSDVMISFADPYPILEDILQNPKKNGFNVTTTACCGGGRLKAQMPCLPIFGYCSNRSTHVFWDPWHPTEASNLFLVNAFLFTNKTLVTPWTITELLFW